MSEIPNEMEREEEIKWGLERTSNETIGQILFGALLINSLSSGFKNKNKKLIAVKKIAKEVQNK